MCNNIFEVGGIDCCACCIMGGKRERKRKGGRGEGEKRERESWGKEEQLWENAGGGVRGGGVLGRGERE